jgi:SAM-dependent methyltransferase
MDNTEFALFYDKQPDYTAFRNDPGKQDDYKILVDWKVRTLTRLIPDDLIFGNILEVGCAFGVLLNNIADRLKINTRIGIDISGENIKTAQSHYPECSFFRGTIEEFVLGRPPLLKDQRFDLIVLSDIVEHVPDDLGFLNQISKISSYVLLNLPLEKSFKTRNRNYGESDPSGHLRCYDKNLAKQLVRSAGFKIVKDFTLIATSDKMFFDVYRKNRTVRINAKPFYLKFFWSLFYMFEDRFKLMNRKLTEKIYGTNYFAFLRSIN